MYGIFLKKQIYSRAARAKPKQEHQEKHPESNRQGTKRPAKATQNTEPTKDHRSLQAKTSPPKPEPFFARESAKELNFLLQKTTPPKPRA